MDKIINVNISTGTLLRLFVFVLIVLALFKVRSLILVILTAIVVASFIDFIINKLGRLAKYRTLTVLVMYFLMALVLSGLFYLFAPVFITELSDFTIFIQQYLPDSEFLNNFQNGSLGQAKSIISELTSNVSAVDVLRNVEDFISNISSGFLQTISVVFGGVLNLIFIVVVSFYLAIQERGIENFLRIVVPGSYEEYAISLWQRTERKIALWVQGQLLLGLLVGVLMYLGLSIFSVRYALLLAVLAAIFELIPFGIILAAVPIIAFAYLDGGVTLALVVAGFVVIVQQFENYLFVPLIIKKAVGISPLAIILALLIGAQLAGFWGVVLAIPVAVLILEFVDDLEKKRKMCIPSS